jgi:hypothetical protein
VTDIGQMPLHQKAIVNCAIGYTYTATLALRKEYLPNIRSAIQREEHGGGCNKKAKSRMSK